MVLLHCNKRVRQDLRGKKGKDMYEIYLERAKNQVKENLGEIKVYLASALGELGCEYKGKSTSTFYLSLNNSIYS